MEKINVRFNELPTQAQFFLEEEEEYTKISYKDFCEEVGFNHAEARMVNCRRVGAGHHDPESYTFLPDDQVVQVKGANGVRIKSLNEIMAQPAPPPDPKLEEELKELRKALGLSDEE